MTKKSIITEVLTFIKAQFSAGCGNIVDYVIMLSLTRLFHQNQILDTINIFGIPCTKSIIISGICGAIINFSINHIWAFRKAENCYKNTVGIQLLKFSVVVAGCVFMKSAGANYLFTTLFASKHYISGLVFSRLMVDVVVSLGFNYTLMRLWVFKKIKN